MVDPRNENDELKNAFMKAFDNLSTPIQAHPYVVLSEIMKTTNIPEQWMYSRAPIINARVCLENLRVENKVMPRTLESLQGSQFLPLFHDFVETTEDGDEDEQLI